MFIAVCDCLYLKNASICIIFMNCNSSNRTTKFIYGTIYQQMVHSRSWFSVRPCTDQSFFCGYRSCHKTVLSSCYGKIYTTIFIHESLTITCTIYVMPKKQCNKNFKLSDNKVKLNNRDLFL